MAAAKRTRVVLADQPWRVSTSAAVEERHPRAERRDAGEIQSNLCGCRRPGQRCRGRHHSPSGCRLEPEPSAPADRRRESCASERADRDSCAHRRAPNCRGAGARSPGGKRTADRAEPRGEDASTGHTLQHSGRRKLSLHARCQRAEGARAGQQPGAAPKNAPVTEVIGQRAGGREDGLRDPGSFR